MLDYYYYTTDASYNPSLLQALLAPTNLGANKDFMPEAHADEEGNDDLSVWTSVVMSAAERNFPQPNPNLPSWLQMSSNVFNQLVGRWDTAHCNGGLFWQIYASNPNGLKYKNSIANGGLFQLAARLASATGNQTYLQWAEKTWDWNMEIGFIDSQTYRVYDGAGIDSGCKDVNKKSFSYTQGYFLYGAAVMSNYTGQEKWAQRTEQLLDEAAAYFFTGKDKNIMWEPACEPQGICNYDMITFKGFLSRFMWQTAQVMPKLRPKIEALLVPTAKAAAATCTGGPDGHQCGIKWYAGGYDDGATLGAQMCALQTISGLLSRDSQAPLKAQDIKWVKDSNFKPIDTYANEAISSSSIGSSSSSKRDVSPPTVQTQAPAPPPAQQNDKVQNKSEASILAGSDLALMTVILSTVLAVRGWV